MLRCVWRHVILDNVFLGHVTSVKVQSSYFWLGFYSFPLRNRACAAKHILNIISAYDLIWRWFLFDHKKSARLWSVLSSYQFTFYIPMQGRDQLTFSGRGKNDCNLLVYNFFGENDCNLYLTTKCVFQNFGGEFASHGCGLVPKIDIPMYLSIKRNSVTSGGKSVWVWPHQLFRAFYCSLMFIV